MDVLELVKRRASIRKYQDRPIPKKVLDAIIEAGIWGPAVPSFLAMQPWKFIVITNKQKINELSDLLYKKAQKSSIGVKVLLTPASKIVASANVVVVVYNTNELSELENKYKTVYADYKKIIKTAQISAISAAIQNMILVAEDLGVGTCWLDTPLFNKKNINKFLNVSKDNELLAFLTLGYSDQQGKRSKRKFFSDAVEFI